MRVCKILESKCTFCLCRTTSSGYRCLRRLWERACLENWPLALRQELEMPRYRSIVNLPETMSDELIPVLYESSGCINISEDFKICCFFFGAGFSREVERGWGGPESSTERLWDVQESASRDGELFFASVCDFNNRDAWHLTVCWQQWAEGCVVMLLVHRKGSCSGYRAVWSRRRRAGGRSWSSHRLISERLVKTNTLRCLSSNLHYSFDILVRFNAKMMIMIL